MAGDDQVPMYHVQGSDLPSWPLGELRQGSGLGGGMLHSLRLVAAVCPNQTQSTLPLSWNIHASPRLSFSLFCSYRQQHSCSIYAQSVLAFWVNTWGITLKHTHCNLCEPQPEPGRVWFLHVAWLCLSFSGPEGGAQHALAGLALFSVPHMAGPLLESWDQK